jgi:hypothetical protein
MLVALDANTAVESVLAKKEGWLHANGAGRISLFWRREKGRYDPY